MSDFFCRHMCAHIPQDEFQKDVAEACDAHPELPGCRTPTGCVRWCTGMKRLLKSSRPARQQLCNSMCEESDLAQTEAKYAGSLCRMGMLPRAMCELVPEIARDPSACMAYCEDGMVQLLES